MKYNWHVDYVYGGEMKSLIGKHSILIKLSRPLNFYSEEVENFYRKNNKPILAYFKRKQDKYSLLILIEKINHLVINDLNKNSNDEKEVIEVMRLLKKLKEDPKLREKKEFINKLKSKKGSGEI